MKIINILIAFFCSVDVSCGSSQKLLPDKAEVKVNVQRYNKNFLIFNNTSFDTKVIEKRLKSATNNIVKVKINPKDNKIAPDRAADCLIVKNADYGLAKSKLRLHSFLSSFAGVPIAQLYAYFLLKKYRSDLELADEHYTQCINGSN